LHNVHGDGYSLEKVDANKLRKLYWPQQRRDVIESYWSNWDRQRKPAVINGNHIPRSVPNELYSKRIEVMAALASRGGRMIYTVADGIGGGPDRQCGSLVGVTAER
jgi:hypothetical protein